MTELKVVKIDSRSDVKSTLEDAIKMSDDLSSVIVLGLKKDSSQLLLTSTMSGMEKAFLMSFLNAWMTKWFQLED